MLALLLPMQPVKLEPTEVPQPPPQLAAVPASIGGAGVARHQHLQQLPSAFLAQVAAMENEGVRPGALTLEAAAAQQDGALARLSAGAEGPAGPAAQKKRQAAGGPQSPRAPKRRAPAAVGASAAGGAAAALQPQPCPGPVLGAQRLLGMLLQVPAPVTVKAEPGTA
jgi:hypothetical protein